MAEQTKQAKPDKQAKQKKAKPNKGPAVGGAGEALPSVARHPRAGAQIARAKAWGGLIGFGLVALLSFRAHVPLASLLLRALAGGIVAYVVAWAAAVALWRHLVIAELRAVRVHRAAERAAQLAAQPER